MTTLSLPSCGGARLRGSRLCADPEPHAHRDPSEHRAQPRPVHERTPLRLPIGTPTTARWSTTRSATS